MAQALIGTVLALAAAGSFWWVRHKPATPSIAVLPVEDLIEKKNYTYLSDGSAEEILNALMKVRGLRVAGRTSSFQFRDHAPDIQTIAKALKVSTILEGTVQPQGNRARIAVRLIKTADGFQLWSETYEGDLSDVLAIEQTVAEEVAAAMNRSFTGPGTAPARRTDPEAYRAYLQGKYLFRQRSKASFEEASADYEKAIQADPEYGPAWVGLAECRSSQIGLGYLNDKNYGTARAAVQKALQLDPNLAEAYATRGDIQWLADRNWAGADQSYRRAVTLKPGSPDVLVSAASFARIMGRLDEAIRLYRQALDANPLGRTTGLALILYDAGKYDEAIATLNKTAELNPNTEFTHALLAQVYFAKSNARAALEEADREKHAVLRLAALAMAYHAAGRKTESDQRLSELIAARDAVVQVAQVYAFRGEPDRAFEWLDRAYKERDPGIAEMKSDPILKRLNGDPRYAAMLKALGLSI